MDSLLPKSKVCSKCGEEKLLGEFGGDKTKKYGVEGQCKLCKKQYRKENRERRLEYDKKYNKDNKEKRKKYREDNKEKIADKRKERYQDNRELFIERSRQYRQANKDKINKWTRSQIKNNEQYRIRKNLCRNLHHVLNNIGKRKNASILTYIGCSIEYLQEHLNSTKNPEWGDDLHIDHIIPKGDEWLAYIDGLIDVYNYKQKLDHNNKEPNLQHVATHGNAEIDG